MPDDTRIVSVETSDPVEILSEPQTPTRPEPVVVTVPELDPDPQVVPEPALAPSPAIPGGLPTGAPPHVAPPARRRALRPWAIAAAVLVVLGAAGVGATYTPVFRAKTITVSGEHRLSEHRILQIAGIGPHTDVIHLDLGAAERRLERNPWIAHAVVSRHLPSTLSVSISERRPVALTRTATGRLVYVAIDGRVLAPAPGGTHLPEVRIAGGTTDASELAAGATVAQGLPRSLVPSVAAISVDATGSVVVTMRSGVTAAYGDASEAQAKGQALKAVIDYAAAHATGLVSVNLEVPGAPSAVFTATAAPLVHPRP